MLQVYLIGPVESGFLDIEPTVKLDMEGMHDAFDSDFTLGEFSIPIDIDFTDGNVRKLAHANRLVNNKTPEPYYIVNVYDDGYPELLNAKATILSKHGDLNTRKGKFRLSISGTKGLFGSVIFNKKLADINYGGNIIFTEISSRDFATAVMKGNYPQYNYLAFAPVAIENFFNKARPDYDNEFLAKDTVNYIVITGSGTNDWEFGRPRSSDPDTPEISGNPEYIDFRTVPFLTLKFVLQKLFNHFGFTVSGALITDNYFDDLYIFNNWSIDVLSKYLYTDSNRNILLKNHVPDMLVKDFLKAVFSFFKIFMTFSGSSVVLNYKKQLLANKTPVAFTAFCSPLFETETTTEKENGYTLAYVTDGNDSYYSDRVKDLSDKTLVATVATRSDLDSLDIGRDFSTNDIALVQNENLYYCVADATSFIIKWDCYAENLDSYKTGAGELSSDIGCSTLCQYVEFNGTDALYERRNYLGCRMAGSYMNNKGLRIISPHGLSLFYIKKQVINGVNIPVSFNHNAMPNGTVIEPYSLALNAGFAQNFHTAWMKLLSNMESVKFSITTNRQALQLYNTAECLEIKSILYIPYKTERSIPAGEDFEAYLVPL